MAQQQLNAEYASFLLGRAVTAPVLPENHRFVTQKVLVTGAGGSIGTQLALQLQQLGAELVLLDRDETALQETKLLLTAAAEVDSTAYVTNTAKIVLADIRDEKTVKRVVAASKPQAIIHAAALKHVELLEQYPAEAWHTNVLGTRNLITAALEAKVAVFVNISTDKAASPISVLGKTKAISERLVSWAATVSGRDYISVRFGNVLGSRGSLLPVLEQRLALGLPLELRDPQATRYFMTIAEACSLVLEAAALNLAAQVAVLDMGEPVLIADLMQRVLAWHGGNGDIVTTALCPGEKRHETLIGDGETLRATTNPKIFAAGVDPLPPQLLDAARRQLLG